MLISSQLYTHVSLAVHMAHTSPSDWYFVADQLDLWIQDFIAMRAIHEQDDQHGLPCTVAGCCVCMLAEPAYGCVHVTVETVDAGLLLCSYATLAARGRSFACLASAEQQRTCAPSHAHSGCICVVQYCNFSCAFATALLVLLLMLMLYCTHEPDMHEGCDMKDDMVCRSGQGCGMQCWSRRKAAMTLSAFRMLQIWSPMLRTNC